MTVKLNDEQTLKFVTLYRENECLWDVASVNYKKKHMRLAALKKISEEMKVDGLGVEEVKAKIKSIRSTYYLELDKIEHSTRFGAEDNVYVPKIKWFQELHSFIKSAMVKRKTKENLRISNRVKSEKNKETESILPKSPTASTTTPPPPLPPPPPPPPAVSTKRPSTSLTTPQLKSKHTKLSYLASIINDIKTMSDNINAEPADEHEIFGSHVAAQLRKLSEEQAIIAQEEIQGILSKCRLNDVRYQNVHYPTPIFSKMLQDPLMQGSISSHSLPPPSPASTSTAEDTITGTDRSHMIIYDDHM